MSQVRRTQFSRGFSSASLKDVRRESSGVQIVAMMQSTEPWHGEDFAPLIVMDLGFSSSRSFLLQSKMRPVVVIIANVFVHQSFQMPFVEHDHMVDQIPSTVANPTLCDTILPRTSEASPLGLDAEALHRVNHVFLELCATVEDQILGNRVVRERFAQLLRDPRTGWMPSHVAA